MTLDDPDMAAKILFTNATPWDVDELEWVSLLFTHVLRTPFPAREPSP